ncbi:MAG: hypothetical protein FJX20_23370 [Alphaproteobacteria bacterium]|nr:hypothetical protein [Alphaproteobacteria bacterium]
MHPKPPRSSNWQRNRRSELSHNRAPVQKAGRARSRRPGTDRRPANGRRATLPRRAVPRATARHRSWPNRPGSGCSRWRCASRPSSRSPYSARYL